jgi:phosphoglucosamine mutase
VPDELDADYVTRLAFAAARVLGPGPWLIGEDTRESSSALASAFRDGLRAGGAKPELGKVVPTPALAAVAAMHRQPAAMITASHNPWFDNGVKIFAPGGLKLSDEMERSIEAALDLEPAPDGWYVGADLEEHVLRLYVEDYFSAYADDCLAGLRIVLDCANGAMFEAAPDVVRRLGADVIVIHAEPNGRNINDQCGATNPGDLCRAVVENGADLGLAFDGDGDRVIAVDHMGQTVDGDRMIGMFRAHGLLAPVWDLPVGTGAEVLEEPAARFAAALEEALTGGELSASERSARAGLANRQVTIR